MGSDSTDPKPRRVLIVGAGAVGCFVAARLTQTGWAPSLLARGESLDALQAGPLHLDDPDGEVEVTLNVVAAPGEGGPYDLIIVAVKRAATSEVAAGLMGHLAAGGVVLSFQNGIDNADILAPIAGPERTGGVAVYVGVRRDAPDRVIRLSGRNAGEGARRDRLVGGPSGPIGDAVTAVGAAIGLDVEILDRPEEGLWRKLVANTALNSVTALGRSRIGPVLESPAASELMLNLGRETVAVARAAGVELDPMTAERYMADISTRLSPQFGSSTLFDLEEGRALEHDALVGAVVRKAEALGVDVPHARACDALLRLVDPGREPTTP